MKLLATIKSVEITRKVQRPDGTWGNVYGVTLVSGDDKILAECWKPDEAQKKAGIVPNAIGTAFLEFTVNRGTSKAGNPYCIQNIRLVRFDLANRNLNPADALSQVAQTAADTAKAAEQLVEQVKAEPEPQPEEGKTSDLPF